MPSDYNDIINIEYKKSTKYSFYATRKRVAQFAPFSVFKGFNVSIEKTKKEIERKLEKSTYKCE